MRQRTTSRCSQARPWELNREGQGQVSQCKQFRRTRNRLRPQEVGLPMVVGLAKDGQEERVNSKTQVVGQAGVVRKQKQKVKVKQRRKQRMRGHHQVWLCLRPRPRRSMWKEQRESSDPSPFSLARVW